MNTVQPILEGQPLVYSLTSYLLYTLLVIVLLLFAHRMSYDASYSAAYEESLVLYTKHFQKTFAKKSKAINLAYNDKITECIENVRDIKANGRQDAHVAQVAEQFANYEKQAIKAEIGVAIPISTASLILKVGMATSMVAGVYLLASSTIDMLVFIAFMMLATRIFEPIEGAFMNIAAIFNAQIAIDRMKEIEGTPSQEGAETFAPQGYDIAFENVGFAYETSEKVLDNLSFVAKQGEVTALVGPSGGGKSTAMRLSARFWDATEGAVKIGGVDISTIDPEELLKSISIVFQDVTLFNNTVMENIRIGRKDATDEEVMAVAKMANCDEFVSKLPDGYQSFIGENGHSLSGGERQRLSIARALLKDAPIILLDEATSSLDIKNESLVQDAIATLIKDKTVLVIAHRMRTVAGADKIVLIKDGTVAEEGSYQDLIAQDGLYNGALHLPPSIWSGLLAALFAFFRLFMPTVMAFVLLFKTTKISEFMAAFEKIHCPAVVVIPFTVMFRFFPTVQQEWEGIRQAMSFRGIGLGAKGLIFHPIQAVEHILVPLLISSVNIMDELIAASLARGLDNDKKRTCYFVLKLRWYNYLVCLATLGFAIFMFLYPCAPPIEGKIKRILWVG